MYKHVFGPVPSRRLGISLGVDLVVSKSCNLNCIFCECGATKKIQLERQRFKDMNEILEEISAVLKDIKPDYITFSGSGEPTLSLDLGNISKAIKEDLKYQGKICLITNSLLLADENLMKELEYIDLIVPTLNTLTQDIFEKIVRPDYRTSVEEIRKGFINLNKSNYKGKIWIEIFILENIEIITFAGIVFFCVVFWFRTSSFFSLFYRGVIFFFGNRGAESSLMNDIVEIEIFNFLYRSFF